jgi:ribonuclease J
MDAIHGTLDSLPKPRRRDPDMLREALRRTARATVAGAWGKKPVCTVFVTVV